MTNQTTSAAKVADRRFSPGLAAELKKLDTVQREAVRWGGNVALTAGPGSGKTRALVARAGYLLENEVSPLRRVGCITYARSAATEISERLRVFNRAVAFRTTSRTFHSFCFNEILRPYAALAGETPPGADSVVDDKSAVVAALRQECYDDLRIVDLEPGKRIGTQTAIRRALSTGEPVSGFDEREIEAARLFEERLGVQGLIDYEAMVSRALSLVRGSAQVRDLFQARYPHLLVDEYQDLGAVLHSLVECLRVEAGVTIFAVGDVDQSLYEFNGANPKYLNELSDNPAYKPLKLTVNYRSAVDLLPLFSAALGVDHGRTGVPGPIAGRHEIYEVEGGLEDHAQYTCESIERLLRQGILPHKIAVLYPGRGKLLTALLETFETLNVRFLHARDGELPQGDLFDFIRSCAQRMNRLIEANDRRGDPDPSLEQISGAYQELRLRASLSPADNNLVLRALQESIDEVAATETKIGDEATSWLADLVEALELDRLSTGGRLPEGGDLNAIGDFLSGVGSLASFIDFVDPHGKIVLTTYHSAKGLGFEAVILPGLVDGVVPGDVPVNNVWGPPKGRQLAEARRAFYVALTRAEHEVVLISGRGYRVTPKWYKPSSPSIFLREMASRLGHM